VILTDTGPLVALIDEDDINHATCLGAAQRLPAQPLLTTWPCFTEAMYLLGSVGGYRYQAELWRLWATGRLILHDLTPAELQRMVMLMEQYRDTPMDLADASLVAAAESHNLQQIFSLDSDFYIYRLANGSVLDIMQGRPPQPLRLPTSKSVQLQYVESFTNNQYNCFGLNLRLYITTGASQVLTATCE